jgi:hypothetical protein
MATKKLPKKPTKKRLTVYLPKDLARRLRVHCAERGVPTSGVIEREVASLLNRLEAQ